MKKGLEAVISMVAGVAAGVVVSNYLSQKRIDEKSQKVDKFKSYYGMLNQWLALRQEGRNLSEYFESHAYKTVAIYGMGEMGNRLYEELQGSSISVKYGIDKNAVFPESDLKIVDLEEKLEDVDIIVVTAIFAFDEIEEQLMLKTDCEIKSLEDIVYET